jgi:hypothetical protein
MCLDLSKFGQRGIDEFPAWQLLLVAVRQCGDGCIIFTILVWSPSSLESNGFGGGAVGCRKSFVGFLVAQYFLFATKCDCNRLQKHLF